MSAICWKLAHAVGRTCAESTTKVTGLCSDSVTADERRSHTFIDHEMCNSDLTSLLVTCRCTPQQSYQMFAPGV